MNDYNHEKIEQKWQKKWEEEKSHKAEDFGKKPKFYCLIEFPFPSADGLHVGHVRSYAAFDIVSRKRRMEGYNVLFPIGFDAFGLPTENFAIKNKISPIDATRKSVENFRRQLKSLGLSFDWDREVNTTDPEYYKWTQWIFLQLFKHGLAYKIGMPINWCLSCKIGLANEEVVGGKCERCGGDVEKRDKEQWMLRITEYADKLDKDLDDVDYLERIKIQQRNWIGKSEGVEINFKGVRCDINCKHPGECVIENCQEYDIPVFTTRVDTIFGVTAMVLSPEHPLVMSLVHDDYLDEVKKYIEECRKKTDIERTNAEKEITGVSLGASAVNPMTGEKVPVWISDYVLAGYGTGAVMSVPAHDERDFKFAKKYGLDIRYVVSPPYDKSAETLLDNSYEEDGLLVNSEVFNGLTSKDARVKIADFIESEKMGRRQMNFHLRDWVFSRQRYWGEPIPIIHCEECGEVPVPEKDLPVLLPRVEHYEPTETGESPLATIESFVNVKCPKCSGDAKRETDTMPNWAGSSWYFLRYIDSKNDKTFADEEKLKYWMGVDWYNGGMEHTTLHLLYSRFWHKFLYDIKAIPKECGSEPYKKRTSHGMILAKGGEKMSKSKGNVVNPDDVIKEYGADILRVYEMFIGPFDQPVEWDMQGLEGVRKFIEKVWGLQEDFYDTEAKKDIKKLLHKTIKKVGEDIEDTKFNTAVSTLMILVNELTKEEKISKDVFEKVVILFAPLAPHISEEMWQNLGNEKSVFLESWPKYDKDLIRDEEIELIIQINGKLRDTVRVSADISEEDARELALASEKVKKHLENKEIKKVIFVKSKLINIVI
ncbi:MAG: leucine--tRNA ligase [Parcubacteria group bacterium]|nr:leucine--tRNA ligase [Parcubacteria group bacterium]